MKHLEVAEFIKIYNGLVENPNDHLMEEYVLSFPKCNSWYETFKSMDLEPSTTNNCLVICPSTERCTHFMKNAHHYFSKGKILIGKLFSRHMKINEQVQFLKTRKPFINVGTPNRIFKILNSTECLADIHWIFVDTSLDRKSLHILNLKDTQKDLLNIISLPNIHNSIKKGYAKIVLY